MLFGKQDQVDAKDFWADREEEIGSPILSKILGRLMDSNAGYPEWGLFYTTEDALWYQTFESHSWASMLLGGKGTRGENTVLRIPTETMKEFSADPGRAGILGFFRVPSSVKVVWIDPLTEKTRTLAFETEGEGDALEFISSLPGAPLK
ncbi:MAG: hypothetical protein MI717_13420 [Spirochaetales bacterium]|nr:hypothetical protein [Spirochaetales bacterium]